MKGARLSADESRVLTWSSRGGAAIWDIASGKRLKSFAEKQSVEFVDETADEQTLFTWSNGIRGEVTMWDVAKQSPIRTFRHDGASFSGALSHDKRYLLTNTVLDLYGKGGDTKLWDVTKDVPLETIREDRRVSGVQFFGNDSILMWGDAVTIRTLAKSGLKRTFTHSGWVRDGQFLGNAASIMTSGDDGQGATVKLWDLRKTEPTQTFRHDSHILGSEWNKNKTRLLTWSTDKTAKLWSIGSSTPLNVFRHNNRVMGAIFNRDETRVLTWSEDKTARLWDFEHAEPLRIFEHNESLLGARFDEACERVLTWSADGTAKLWDLSAKKDPQVFRAGNWVYDAKFLADESRVLTRSGESPYQSSQSNEITIWNISDGQRIHSFQHGGRILGVAMSHDQSRILSWSADGTAKLWETSSSEPIQVFQHGMTTDIGGLDLRVSPRPAHVFATFSSDESRVLTWSEDGSAKLWKVGEKPPLRVFKHNDRVTGATFCYRDTCVLSWSQDGTAKLWRISQDEPLQTFRHSETVTDARLSKDESLLLTITNGTAIHAAMLWDVARAEPLIDFRHNDQVDGALFSGDGDAVLTWSQDGTARLWDIALTNGPLSPEMQRQEFEVRSATWLDALGTVRPIEFDDWDKRRSEVSKSR